MTDADATSSGGVGVVIVAAGAGARLGAGMPKAFVEVGGRSLLSYAVERAAAVADLAALVIVVAEQVLAHRAWPADV
ncbi:MAG TPA: 2-C-methyl-D-erythritol 4-phosphate cytidylyltransferase, partial [Phycicoccus sp.]|nr:2-C-methyl-D-erythritol 4-phosphate cytidylyltransferase [Phycicoccus sp.]